jgi:hypothetical protein
MLKEVYILNHLPSEDYISFKERIFDLSKEVLDQFEPETLKICLTLKRPPLISVIPFKKKKVAVLSVTRKSGSHMDLITNAEGYTGGYQVEEAVPVSYSRSWKDGEPTPGECLLTLLHRKPGIDQETFVKRWHQGHTPLSLKLHPLWNYNRNVVLSVLTEDSVWYDGIVEEQFQKSSDLLNPLVFFGPPHKVPLHMYQVLMDTRSFIDMKRIETYLATEIHFKS